jgi:hypothetical protein
MTTLSTSLSTRRVNPAVIGCLVAFITLGALLGEYPMASLALIGATAIFILLVILVRKVAVIELWQALVLLAITGYVVLTYGFANLAFHVGGIPMIFGDGLMLAALGLVVIRHRLLFVKALREPAARCLLILIAMTLFRLIFDVPHFGLYAIRDSSIFTEGIFLVLGLVWSMQKRNISVLMKWLTVLFVLNLVYASTFPIGDELKNWSPHSGIFLDVPLLGSYAGNGEYLLAGSLFCVLVGRHAVGWPRWSFVFIALIQLLALTMLQIRAMYLALLICLCVLALLGQIRKCAALLISTSLALIALYLLASVLGIQLSGRVGPVNLTFLGEHASSLLGKRYAPAAGSIEDREDWYGEVWGRLRSDPTAMLVGEGFGMPLIDFMDAGVATRQPHNCHLSVLARLGVLGLVVWIAFHLSILKTFVHAFRARASLDSKLYAVILWLFLLYIILMIDASVTPSLEMSFGSIPFYFLTGFALGVIRYQLKSAPCTNRELANVEELISSCTPA